MSLKKCLVLFALSLFAIPLGCGDVSETKLPESGATLTGAVTLDGAEIEFAMILVQGANGTATGNIKSDGKFVVENVPLGEVTIAVNTQAARGDYQTKMMQSNAGAMDPNSSKKIKAAKFVDVPAKFFDAKTSGLTATIVKGPNEKNLDLKSSK